ncbi:hypothetical protein JB92DRAFT_3114820 [Gautieria morchelliformis]|nr:hypothetical protein JB92DRAFT_3114820 [Gautieria morchelliformis]
MPPPSIPRVVISDYDTEKAGRRSDIEWEYKDKKTAQRDEGVVIPVTARAESLENYSGFINGERPRRSGRPSFTSSGAIRVLSSIRSKRVYHGGLVLSKEVFIERVCKRGAILVGNCPGKGNLGLLPPSSRLVKMRVAHRG